MEQQEVRVDADVVVKPPAHQRTMTVKQLSAAAAVVTIALFGVNKVWDAFTDSQVERKETSRAEREAAAADKKFIQDKMFEQQALLINAMNNSAHIAAETAKQQTEAASEIKEGLLTFSDKVGELASQQEELINKIDASTTVAKQRLEVDKRAAEASNSAPEP